MALERHHTAERLSCIESNWQNALKLLGFDNQSSRSSGSHAHPTPPRGITSSASASFPGLFANHAATSVRLTRVTPICAPDVRPRLLAISAPSLVRSSRSCFRTRHAEPVATVQQERAVVLVASRHGES